VHPLNTEMKWACLLACLALNGAMWAQQAAVQTARLEASPDVLAAPLEAVRPTAEATPEARRWSRAWLEEKGVSYTLLLRGEAMGSMRGGLSGGRPLEPMGSFDASMKLDLAKLVGWRGEINVAAQSLHGADASDELIGAQQKISNLNEHPFSKITELYYADGAGRWRWKLGRMYADAEFGSVEHAAAFMNAGFGVLANSPMPTYPAPSPAAVLAYRATERLSFVGGVYRGAKIDRPESGRARQGLYVTGEAQWKPRLWADGDYRVGAWRQASSRYREEALAGDRARTERGVYLTIDQRLRREGATYAFFRMSFGEGAERTRFWNGGFERRGWFGRREDAAGLGFTRLHPGVSEPETITELYYKARLRKGLWAQPDVQHIICPGGARRNAWAGGVRLLMEF